LIAGALTAELLCNERAVCEEVKPRSLLRVAVGTTTKMIFNLRNLRPKKQPLTMAQKKPESLRLSL